MEEESLREEIRFGGIRFRFQYARAISLFNFVIILLF